MAKQRQALIWCALFVLQTKVLAICNENQFTCSDGRCILREKMCDGRQDCSDNKDELNCDMEKCESPKWYQCRLPNGPCLSSELICNGFDNCPGGEDEHHCMDDTSENKTMTLDFSKWHDLQRNCSKFEFSCTTDKTCIPLDFMCDGKEDCEDNSDETVGCDKAKTNCKGFFCANNKCLESKTWACDGTDDCGDNSDEQHCMGSCTMDVNKFACSDNKTCIDLAQVCDGFTHCSDGSDEASGCSKSQETCRTMTCPAAAKCQKLSNGQGMCVCPSGFRLSANQKSCEDIDECSEHYGICSQKCTNPPGRYKCLCDEGYKLRSDNRTCEALGGEAMLLYTTQVTVMGVNLGTKRVHTIAANLSKVIGVAYDGRHLFWTNIQHEAESIVRANVDGSEQEILLTSGLDSPEDLAVDWLTGNIYFSDNIMHHIAVCSNDGVYCSILVTIDVHQPRGIALWPQMGQMFWTDWGVKPMIARASMDGGGMVPIVSSEIHWPNGIALDMHNNRIYWVDAKLSTVESARTDGTDRRIVLQDILKHPYGLAVFEEKLYWSDWETKSIHACDKFTGKQHEVIVKDRTMYAVHVYHKAKQTQSANPCVKAQCSHLCLLRENHTFSCACPDDMMLSADQLRCTKTQKRRTLFMAIRNNLLEMEHTNFGRHKVERTHTLPVAIHEMTYNSVNGTIIMANNIQQTIYEYDAVDNMLYTLTSGNMGNITGLAFDHLSHSVYWVDSERHVVEVLSLRTRERAIVSFFSGQEDPIALTVIPEDGVMFVALRNRRMIHIDQLALSGQGPHVHAFEEDLGNREVKFATDFETTTLYFTDSDLGQIFFTDYRSLEAHPFRSRLRRPYSMAVVDGDLFWSELHSSAIHWTHKSNLGPLKRVDIEPINKAGSSFKHSPTYAMKLLATSAPLITDHPCQHDNGGCSHVCVTLTKDTSACLCPAGLVFKDGRNHTCIESLDCEFRCDSGECLTQSHRCNGRRDCPDGSDERNCHEKNGKKAKVMCEYGEVACHNAEQCIDVDLRCDGNKDCNDGSDEDHCEQFDSTKNCHHKQFACENGRCVDLSSLCDGINDCDDNSDEENCHKGNGTRKSCGKDMFECNVGSCIAKDWECDGKIDCIDGSDEHGNCDFKECPAKMHKCLMGQCIAEQLKCDGHNDCGDLSDELNCQGTERKDNFCDDEQYQCTSSNLCLDYGAKCNGTAECPRGEDEADCGGMCGLNEFQCKASLNCIRAEFRCDHERDCLDGSDEVDCLYANNGTSHSHESACLSGMFDCKDGRCVSQKRVCNGFDDCDNGADEGALCDTACKSSSGRAVCEHMCHATPTGAKCSCMPGFKLDVDQRTCHDIDECEENNPCAQLCENTRGSYRCSCFAQFMLRTDKTTCKSMARESAWLFSTYNEVRSMVEHPVTLNVAWSANDSKITGFDIDVHRRQAYFSTEGEDVLYRVNMTTGEINAALSVTMPSKVAVDWITGNVYVINRANGFQISACSFESQMCGRLLVLKNNEVIRALTVDSYNRKMFFATIKSLTFGSAFSQIHMTHLDGREKQILVSKHNGYITALAVDVHKKQLYYVDMHAKVLQSVSYAVGSDFKPKTIIQKGFVVMHPSGLAVYENEAIIVNIGAKQAMRCKLFADNACSSFNLNILNAEDITVDGASRQPLRTDACLMADCRGMCIQAEYGYECLCGDNMVVENQTCAKGSHQISSSTLFKSKEAVEEKTGHGGGFMMGFIIMLIVLVIIGIGYYYYKRLTGQGHRDFNINLHFQNPLAKFAHKSASDSKATNASEACDNEWQKVSFAIPKLPKYVRSNTNTDHDMEILLDSTTESSDICTLGGTGEANSILVNANCVKYDATRSNTRQQSDARLVDLM